MGSHILDSLAQAFAAKVVFLLALVAFCIFSWTLVLAVQFVTTQHLHFSEVDYVLRGTEDL